MHITLEADYAIRIVDCLARARERLNAQAIAEKCSVTLRFALKILSKLAGAGIVLSYKGSRGGYEIGRPLGDISINDIYEAINGPFQFARCLKDGYSCVLYKEDQCPYHVFFNSISGSVRERLKETSLAEMVTHWEI